MELIICEKPNAAKKIAEALADGKAKVEKVNGVAYYTLTHGKKDILVGTAVGHLFGLKETVKQFPNFQIDWFPTSDLHKGAAFSKKYLTLLRKLAKRCDEFTVATDFDVEGEVIGLNIIRYVAGRKDANRMKFSTLTKDALIKSYETKSKTLDWGQANAGETRHKLDWYYGINISRVLTDAIKKGGMFKLLSTGRVQGPTLKMLTEREKEIAAFKAEPFWELELRGDVQEGSLVALHKKGKFLDEQEAKDILAKVKGEAVLSDIKSKEFKQNPPVPFDLTSLQMEAHTKLKISPKETLSLAQELYTGGFMSYPRTSSQKYPKEIEVKKILKDLTRNPQFKKYADTVLKGPCIPNEGKKDDPAHPAIYPTGIIPDGLDEREQKLYNLIVHRFLAVFGKPAIKETVTYSIDCEGEIFTTKGTVTKVMNWLELYGVFGKQKDEELPKATVGEKIQNKKVKKLDKETQPPKRYNEASIIKELEKRNLGTKATRASILDTLFKRDYIDGKKIEVTELGMKVEQILDKYFPTITDEKLTREFEEDMQLIHDGKEKPEEVLLKAQKIITEVIKNLEKTELKLGKELMETFQETKDKAETFGPCHKCEKGTLKLRKGKFGRFIACDAYPDCKTTFSLPKTGMVKPTEAKCSECASPMVMIIKRGKRPHNYCLNADCKTKEAEKVEGEGKTCEKCKVGKMILRRSLYGQFLGCDQYPKCKTMISLTKKTEEEAVEHAVKELKKMK